MPNLSQVVTPSNVATIDDIPAVVNETASTDEFFLVFSDNTSGRSTTSYVSNDKLTYQPSNGTLTTTNFNALSDVRYKKNVETITDALNVVSALRGVSFEWRKTDSPSYGVIAQELEDVLPELVSNSVETDSKSVNYNGLVAILIEAVKNLSNRVEQLENK